MRNFLRLFPPNISNSTSLCSICFFSQEIKWNFYFNLSSKISQKLLVHLLHKGFNRPPTSDLLTFPSQWGMCSCNSGRVWEWETVHAGLCVQSIRAISSFRENTVPIRERVFVCPGSVPIWNSHQMMTLSENVPFLRYGQKDLQKIK